MAELRDVVLENGVRHHSRLSGSVAGVLVGVVGVAAGAWWSVDLPFTDVPQSLQTLAVLTAGVCLGVRRGLLAVVVYLLLGALGVPVFAGGTGGVERLVGPTAGFLFGFLPAVALSGWWVGSRRAGSYWRACGGMALAHGVILAFGWAWLTASLGGLDAWSRGVQPFLWGAVAKTLAAGLIAWLVSRPTLRQQSSA